MTTFRLTAGTTTGWNLSEHQRTLGGLAVGYLA
jgi:hypothetical protein